MPQTYREYLNSDEWKYRSLSARARAAFRCEATYNGIRCGNRATESHHKTYSRLGHERDEDLMAICRLCHKRLHHVVTMAANDNQLPLPF